MNHLPISHCSCWSLMLRLYFTFLKLMLAILADETGYNIPQICSHYYCALLCFNLFIHNFPGYFTGTGNAAEVIWTDMGKLLCPRLQQNTRSMNCLHKSDDVLYMCHLVLVVWLHVHPIHGRSSIWQQGRTSLANHQSDYWFDMRGIM